MLSAFCFIVNIKKRITNSFNCNQDSIPKITSRDAEVYVVKGPQLDILPCRLGIPAL